MIDLYTRVSLGSPSSCHTPRTSATLLASGDTRRDLPGPSSLVAEAPASSPRFLSLDVTSRFGARLRELRRERNLTQTRMSSIFGIDRSFISDVERGRKSISLPMLEVIALGLDITLSDLLKDV